MKIGIVGAGAIGCTLGARLARGGAQVLLVGRPWLVERVSAGLVLSRWGEPPVAFPEGISASDQISAIADCDVVFVSTKSKDTRAVAREIAAVLPAGKPVGSLQNGVRNAGILANELPGHTIWPAMVPFNVVWLDEGRRLHQGTSGPVVLPRDAADVVAVLVEGGAQAVTHADVEAVQWGKLLLNLNNAINALSGLPLREMLSDRGYRKILASVIREGRDTLRAAGIRAVGVGRMRPGLAPFVLDLPDWLFFRAASAMIHIDPLARSSMADDLARGRTTEVDDLNGEIVSRAASSGRIAPLNAALVRLICDAQRDGVRPLPPDALWAALHK